MNSGKQAQDLFQNMSDTQKRFLIEKDATDEKTVKDWLIFLDDIVRYDVLIDKTTKTLKSAIMLLWVFSIFNIIVAVITSSFPMALLGMAMAGLAIYQRLKRASYFKRDLHNHLREFFHPLLKALFDTVGPDTQVFADFKLREKDTDEYVISFGFAWDDQKSIKAKLTREGYNLKVLIDNEEKEIIRDHASVGQFLEDVKVNVAS